MSVAVPSVPNPEVGMIGQPFLASSRGAVDHAPALPPELLSSMRRAGPRLSGMATELAAHPDGAPLVLAQARSDLLSRLHRRSDDFAATEALRSLEHYSAHLDSSRRTDQSERLVRAGMSANSRLRAWRPSKASASKHR